MRRVRNWDGLLMGWARSVAGRPFVWGITDCGTLARGAALAMYGVDLVPDAPHYRTKTGALRAVGRTSVAAELERAGARRVGVAYLQAGDVLCAPDEDRGPGHAAVCLGQDVLTTDPGRGVLIVPFTGFHADVEVWRLPDE